MTTIDTGAAARSGIRIVERPVAEKVRGTCPKCGEQIVSQVYLVNKDDIGQGYIIRWECWASKQPEPTCDYGKTL